MANTPETGREGASPQREGVVASASELEEWFLREVLPLESMLMRYLQHNWRNQSDIKDILQDIYVRVCESAAKEFPRATKPFVFTTARNLLLNRLRDAQVVPIEAVADVEALSIAVDEPGPDQAAAARDELRRLQSALDRSAAALPRGCRAQASRWPVAPRDRPAHGYRRRNGERSSLIGPHGILSDIFFRESADFRRRP